MTKKQIAMAVAGTTAVAATVGTLYAIYRRRKSLKDMMAPRLRKFTPVQRKRFVVESHHQNLPGNTADEIVEKADNAVRRAKGPTMMKWKLSKRTIKTRRKRSSSTINHGKAAKIVLGVLTALAVAGGTTYAVLSRSKKSPSSPPSSPHSYNKYREKSVKFGKHTKTAMTRVPSSPHKYTLAKDTKLYRVHIDGYTSHWFFTQNLDDNVYKTFIECVSSHNKGKPIFVDECKIRHTTLIEDLRLPNTKNTDDIKQQIFKLEQNPKVQFFTDNNIQSDKYIKQCDIYGYIANDPCTYVNAGFNDKALEEVYIKDTDKVIHVIKSRKLP